MSDFGTFFTFINYYRRRVQFTGRNFKHKMYTKLNHNMINLNNPNQTSMVSKPIWKVKKKITEQVSSTNALISNYLKWSEQCKNDISSLYCIHSPSSKAVSITHTVNLIYNWHYKSKKKKVIISFSTSKLYLQLSNLRLFYFSHTIWSMSYRYGKWSPLWQ